MNRILVYSGLVALVVSAATIIFANQMGLFQADKVQIEQVSSTPSVKAVYTLDDDGNTIPLDFTSIAQTVTPAVVHIKATQSNRADAIARSQDPGRGDYFRESPLEEFFDPRFFFGEPNSRRPNRPQPRVGTGSGVIINSEGYIVTNNHVIEGANDIEVTLLDNRNYKAVIIGTDPTTDLALIQIKEQDLPTVPFVDSDEVEVGEWVMAVGNPFNLTSTVTAGIVSAKGRSINILQEQFAVESFIQTDAAINPGNSGGALVNLSGGLVGINTAIASPTGSYSGYGFAVPTNIVKKVVKDLLEFGAVQRGVLGVMIRTVNGNLMKEKGLTVSQGVYVDSLLEHSAAGAAGCEVGDVIVAVDGIKVTSSAKLQELIARRRPGDSVELQIDRSGKTKTFVTTLNGRSGMSSATRMKEDQVLQVLGVEIDDLSAEEKRNLDIDGGVKVRRLYAGKLAQKTDLQEGFIITKVDGKTVRDVADFIALMEEKSGGVMLEGIYPELPGTQFYAFGM